MRFSSFVRSGEKAQLHVEKLDQAITVIESLNGSGDPGAQTNLSE